MTVVSSVSCPRPQNVRRTLTRCSGAAFAAWLVLAAAVPARADSILVLGQVGNEPIVTALRSAGASASPGDTFIDGGSDASAPWAAHDQVWFVAAACTWDTAAWPLTRFVDHVRAGGTLLLVHEFFGPPKFAGCNTVAEVTSILTQTLDIAVVAQGSDNDTPGFSDPGYCNEPVVRPTGSGVLECPNVIGSVPGTSCSANLTGVPEGNMLRRRATTGFAAGAVFGPSRMTTGVGRLMIWPDMSGLPSGAFLANLVEFGRATPTVFPSGPCLYCTDDSECPDDGNECTADVCGASGLCENAPVAAGTACSAGVCNGAPAECVPCLDTSVAGTDSGCDATTPHCEGSGTAAAVCQRCVDDVSGGPDLGCGGAALFCTEIATGVNGCAECEADGHCDDSIDCTLDRCVPFFFSPSVSVNRCEHTLLAAGASCTGGVCEGTTDQCINCVDDSAIATDSGCAAGAEHCDVGFPSGLCQPCLDTTVDTDLGCADAAPFCVSVPRSPNACAECVSGSDCDDGNECTINACADGVCNFGMLPVGTVCSGGVCNGAPAECVPCLDDSAATTDTGCAAGAPHCEGSGTTSAICQPCVDDMSGGIDLGCGDTQPFCTAALGGPNACLECAAATDCDDGDDCTVDACAAGACESTSAPAGSVCATGVCDGAASPACVECVADAQCDGATALCDTSTGTCRGCLTAADCEDSNDCTTDACDASGLCAHEPLEAGTACTDGVCSEAPPACVTCIDSSEEGTDDGCSEARAHCSTDDGAPSCEICEDSVADGVDRGCSEEDPACVDDPSGGRVCVPCDPCEDAGALDPDAGDPDAGALDAGTPGAVSGGALCGVGHAGEPAPPWAWALLSAVGLFAARRRRR